MNLRSSCALLTLALATCTATTAGAQQSNTRELVRNADRAFFHASKCQAKSTASLSHEQVTGLDELPAAIRDLVLENLPLRATGSPECADAAARLLQERLRAICWSDASVTPKEDGKAGSSDSKIRLRVEPGTRYQLGPIFVGTNGSPKTSPRLILDAAKSAIPTDQMCTAGTLEAMRERVFQLGTFQHVWVTAGPLNAAQKLPVVIEVKEKAPATP